jgi:1-acyl-sn-glycerol-3-phosphate acyltransferase
MNPFYVFAKTVAAIVNKCAFFLKVKGRENTNNTGRVMVVANHVSWYDPVMLGGEFQWKIHFIAKIELFKSDFSKAFLAKLGAFPVARGQGDIGAVRKSMEILREDKCLGIFPEGTRFAGEMGEFQRGAAAIALKTDAKIIPVYTKGPFRFFRQVKVIIGKPFYLKDIVNPKDKDAIDKGTNYLRNTLQKLKEELG